MQDLWGGGSRLIVGCRITGERGRVGSLGEKHQHWGGCRKTEGCGMQDHYGGCNVNVETWDQCGEIWDHSGEVTRGRCGITGRWDAVSPGGCRTSGRDTELHLLL